MTAQAESSTRKKRGTQRASVVLSIDSQLEEDWKHVLNQIVSLLSNDDDPISQMPFEINLESAQTVVDLFVTGCCVDSGHFFYKWLVRLLSPV